MLVLEEITAVNQGVEGGCTDILLVKNFHKTYNKCFRKSIKSLRGISFGVRNKECFVLLGNVNCGKSSVAHILTNETVPNSGDAKIEGYKLSTQWHRFLRMIGYCPETNALHNTMTVYENLKIIVLLKGIPWSQISEEIDFWLTIAGIQKLKNRFVGELSLGTKRILGTIVALIGDPTLVLLDEPTHSIDPESRSCIWSLLSAFQNSSQSFLITTRSIEECQALCQRCAIIFNGEFKCIGPVGFLSRYYVQGFKINILLNPLTEDSVVMEITDKMHKNFSAVLKERTPCYLRMIILSNDITLSTFFTQMETLKEYFHGVIVEFTVVDASLNEVFSNVNLTNEY